MVNSLLVGSLIVATTAALAEHSVPASVTITEYVPTLPVETLVMIGFLTSEVKPFGPVHAKLAPSVAVIAVSISVSPLQGLFAVASTATVLPIVLMVSNAEEEQPFSSVTVIV